jgi:transposase
MDDQSCRACTQESAEQLLRNALTQEQRAGVAAVCIDMWAPFEAAIGTCLPHARIVYAPFHVVSHPNEAVDQVGRFEQVQRLAQGDETLTGSRSLWLHGFEHLNRRKHQELLALLTSELKTGLAWALKEQSRKLWLYKRPSAARGYRNFSNFRVAILFHHGKLDLIPH